MSELIPVIDLFAGPGGLAEGFSARSRMDGRRRFGVVLSIEKDVEAHRTLRPTGFLEKIPSRLPRRVLRVS